MKMLRRFLAVLMVLMFMLLLAAITAFAETAALGATAAAGSSTMQWVTANLATIFLVLLGISESLALLPWFKGNGILDMIIKALRTLAGKPPAS